MDVFGVSGVGINGLLFTLFIAGISPFLLRFFIKYLWTPWAIYGALKKQGFKGPPPRFMLGNLLDIANMMQQEMCTDMPSVDHNFSKRAFPYLVEWSRRYGEKFVIWFGHEPRIVLTDAEEIRRLLSSKHSGRSPMVQKMVSVVFGEGVFSVNGEQWSHQRRIVAPAFNMEMLKGSVSLSSKHLNDCGRSPMIQKMVSVVIGKSVFSVNGEQWSHHRRIVAPAFNMEMLKASVDMMSKCTKELVDEWGETISNAIGGRCEIDLTKYMATLTANIILRSEFGMSDGKLGKELFEDLTQLGQLMVPSFRYLWMPGSSYLPTPTNVEIWKRMRRLEGNLQKMIEERRATGRETTSVLLSWAILLLALHPDWQDKAREEAISIGDILSMDSLGKLKIIGMVLNETLRLYPPGALLVRQAFKDLKLGEDMVIPKGVNVIIDVLSVHRNPKYWGSNANEFRPERFRNGVAEATGNHPSAFIPFSSGPRVCIGQNFAVMEANVAMYIILKHFKFTVSPSYRHAPVAFMVLRSQHGIPIIVESV